MNGHDDGALPMPVDGGNVVNADPVYDAELVEEPPPPAYTRPRLGRFTAWWLRSPRIPMWLKERQHAKQAAKDATVAVLRSPWRYIGAVVRGLIAAARWWRRWVSVRDFREAAELSEKLADKFTEIRALTLFRWKVTGAVLAVGALGLAIIELIYGTRALWITAVVASRPWRSSVAARTVALAARPCSLGRALSRGPWTHKSSWMLFATPG